MSSVKDLVLALLAFGASHEQHARYGGTATAEELLGYARRGQTKADIEQALRELVDAGHLRIRYQVTDAGRALLLKTGAG